MIRSPRARTPRSGAEPGYPRGVPTRDRDRAKPPPPRWAAQAGFVASALAVFTCGWLAMHTNDWRLMLLYTVLALGAAALASFASRRR